MNIFEIAILGLVQGLTEFLPISSPAHLVLFPRFFGWQDPGLAVDAVLHLGTLAAVLLYFRKDLLGLLQPPQRKLLIAIVIATLPAVVLGFGAKSFFGSDLVRSTNSVIITLLIGSGLMFAADLYARRPAASSINSMSIMQVFVVGCMQALALFPGISRSGSTISGSVFLGLSREDAARFAFLVGVPAVAGAGLLSLKDLVESAGAGISPLALSLGFLVSFISGYLAIDFLLKFLKTRSLMVFIIYRLILAVFLALA